MDEPYCLEISKQLSLLLAAGLICTLHAAGRLIVRAEYGYGCVYVCVFLDYKVCLLKVLWEPFSPFLPCKCMWTEQLGCGFLGTLYGRQK
jgi:hypothetical protein